ncbi:hypothetical protein WJX74_002407 [Apatococcus lobatus]|uniref:Uncharacterized protein n=1 Tax=Apatococcus lobatus TaxID=904363 RepID=A0AAW1S958_9CHLO
MIKPSIKQKLFALDRSIPILATLRAHSWCRICPAICLSLRPQAEGVRYPGQHSSCTPAVKEVIGDAAQRGMDSWQRGGAFGPNKGNQKQLFGVVDYSKLSNWLKLRYSARFTDKLAFEAGLDVAPFRGFSAQPGWALHYELTPRGRHIGALRLNTQGVFLRKGFGYHKEDIGGARVNLTGGYRFNGQPHLGVDVDQIEPPAVVAAAAAGLFALGKPLTGSRSLPKVNLDEQYDNVGRIGRVIATGEGVGTLHRRGKKVMVLPKQANLVLRLSQDLRKQTQEAREEADDQFNRLRHK